MPAKLYEREEERAQLSLALSAAAQGHGSVTLIEGPAGIGKSALLADAVERARPLGFEVLSARGLEIERAEPFGTVTDLFGPVLSTADPGERARLAEGQAGLGAALVLDGLGSPDIGGVVRGLFWLLVHLTDPEGSGSRPVAVIVDDIQWTDPPSRRFLSHLAARIDELPVALVLAARSDPGAPERGAEGTGNPIRWLEAARSTRVLSPSPLSEPGVAQLVGEELPAAEPGFVAACARVTGGNPFLLRELARALRAERVEPRDAAVPVVERMVPDAVLRTVLGRLSRLGEDAKRLAAAVAVLGEAPSLHLAASLADLPALEAETAGDLLTRADFLEPGEPVRFSHPVIARAVYDDLPAFSRARHHRRAADLLLAEGAPLDHVAPHLVASRPDGDGEVVRLLREAAAGAVEKGDPETASRMLRRALLEPPASEDRPGLLLELAEAQVSDVDPAAEHTVMEVAAATESTPFHLAALQTLARVRFLQGDRVGAAEAYEAAVTEAETTGSADEQLLAEYLTAHTFESELHRIGHRRLAPVADAAETGHLPNHPGLLAHLALDAALSGRSPDLVVVLARRALAADPRQDASHGFNFGIIVQALVAVDELETALEVSDASLAAARLRGSLLAYITATFHRAIPLYHMGALAEASADLDQTLTVRGDDAWLGGNAWLRAFQVQLELERGDLRAAAAALELAGDPSAREMDFSVVGFARARLALARHDHQAALSGAVESGVQLAEGFGIDHPGFLPWRELAAFAAAAAGRRQEAERWAGEALSLDDERGNTRSRSLALRAAAVADPRRRVERLEEAVALLDGRPAQLERAHALVALGAALHEDGRRAAAQDVLRAGLQVAADCGAAPLADLARQKLRATGARPRRSAVTGVDALTPSERRVATLAEAGLTNNQIAQDLFVTPKTVQTHLAHTYRKLGITSRRELSAALTNETGRRSPTEASDRPGWSASDRSASDRSS